MTIDIKLRDSATVLKGQRSQWEFNTQQSEQHLSYISMYIILVIPEPNNPSPHGPDSYIRYFI